MGGELVLSTAISRRGFLGGLAAGAIVVAIPGTSQALVPRNGEPMPPIILRRREDLLRLTITPFHMTVDKATGRVSPTGDTGLLIVSFGPQSVIEPALLPGQGVAVKALPARLSGPSQLSFVVDSPVSLTLSSLLAWAEREPFIHQIGRYLDGEILPAELPVDKEPGAYFTRIEMPWWLWLTPHRLSSWTEQRTAKTAGGRTEIFHTRLATTLPDEGQTEDSSYRTVRGFWIRDPQPLALLNDPNAEIEVGRPGQPWPTIPTPRDRADIVRLSTRTGSGQVGGAAAAIKARIALSPLGGQLVADGAWDEPGVSSMTAWQQRIWQGRDTYAKVVRRGFLYPWGFKAAQIEEGVRVFRGDIGGTIRAFWEKRTSIAVTEPEINLGDTAAGTDAGKRAALFSAVICKTVQTPPLDLRGDLTPMGGEWDDMRVYTPKVATRGGSTPFPFELVGIDPDGNEVPFTQPLLFAQAKVADSQTTRPNQRRGPDGRFGLDDLTDPNFTAEGAAQLRNHYDGVVDEVDKVADFGGAAIAYAENLANSVTSDDGEVLSEGLASSQTMQSTKQIVFGIANELEGGLKLVQGEVEDLLEEYHPNNFPIIGEAQVYLEDTARLAQETVTAALNYPREYLENAMDDLANQGQVYLQAAEGKANEFLMDAARAGGIASPNMNVAGLSRTLGNVYGDAQALKSLAADGRITPGEAFKALEILGGVTLADLIPNPYPGVDADGKPTPMALKIESTFEDPGLDTERSVTRMSMTIDNAIAGSDGEKLLSPTPGSLADRLITVDTSRLLIDLETVVPTVAGEATWKVRGEFSDFIVHLVPAEGLEFVNVDVERILFTAGSGKSPDVDVKIREVDFSGLLTLLKKLASFLPFGDALVIEVDRRGITAGFMVQLPSIALGAFALSGIGVGGQVSLPFDSGPVRFGFLMSRPEDPFSLTITGLGGGGYLDQALGLKGIERLAITGFVAAEAKVDFGVASGGITVRAGFTFAIGALDPPVGGVDEGLALTAFASLNGNVDVLGIASASIDVYIGLSVVVPADLPDYVMLNGEARVSLRVSVAFFSKTVNFEARRSIKATYLEPPALPDVPDVRGRSARAAEEVPVATFADAWSRDAWDEFCGAFG